MTRAHQIATAGRGLTTLAAGVGDRIAKVWRRYWERRAKRAAVELLRSLDELARVAIHDRADRGFTDIGFTRSDQHHHAHGMSCTAASSRRTVPCDIRHIN
jgi:hypothetical protein